jgi:hypothetical protein
MLANAQDVDNKGKGCLWTIGDNFGVRWSKTPFLTGGFFTQSGEPLIFSFLQFPFGALVFRPLLRKRLVARLSFADQLNGPDRRFNLRVRKFLPCHDPILHPPTWGGQIFSKRNHRSKRSGEGRVEAFGSRDRLFPVFVPFVSFCRNGLPCFAFSVFLCGNRMWRRARPVSP